MKKRLPAALLLTAALALSSVYAQSATNLKDVPAGHWAQEAVQVAVAKGLIQGFPDGTYRGNEDMTRYELAQVLARLLNKLATGELTPAQINQADPKLMGTLQKAVEELRAELAKLGVRVTNLENNAANKADLARLQNDVNKAMDMANQALAAKAVGGQDPAALAALSAQIKMATDQAMAANAKAGDLQAHFDELAGQVEAAAMAADTALGQARELNDKLDELASQSDLENAAAKLNERINGLNNRVDDFGNRTGDSIKDLQGKVDDLTGAFEARFGEIVSDVESKSESITSLNDLVVILNDDVDALQSKVGDLESTVNEQGEAMGLVRRDMTALSDRTTGLEGRVGEVEKRATSLETRVSALEFNSFTISGSLTLKYYHGTTWNANGSGTNTLDFDTDRLFSMGFMGSTVTNPFSSGKPSGSSNSPIFYPDFGQSTANAVDPANGVYKSLVLNKGGDTSVVFKVNLALKRDLKGVANTFPTVLNIELSGDPGKLNKEVVGGTSGNELGLKMYDVEALFSVGNSPLIIQFGRYVNTKFTDYAFNSSGNSDDQRISGFAADLSIPFALNPKLTVVYGVEDNPRLPNPGNNGSFSYDAGIRASVSPFANIEMGGYWAYRSTDIGNKGANPLQRVYGGFLEANKAFGLLDLKGEYSHSETDGTPHTDQDDIYYVKGSVDLGVVTLSGNYRYIGSDYEGLSNDKSLDDKDIPYATNQTGFGAGAAVRLGFLELNGSYNQAQDLDPVKDSSPITLASSATKVVDHTDYKVGAALKFAGFSLTPEFSNLNEKERAGGNNFSLDYTKLLVSLKHDGAAKDAFISGLNINASYQMDMLGGAIYTSAFTRTTIKAGADYKLTLGTFTVRPVVAFEMVNFDKDGVNYAAGVVGKPSVQPSGVDGGVSGSSVTNSRGGDELMRFGYGISVNTGAILFDSVGFELGYSNDSTQHTKNTGGDFTGSTEQWQAGIIFSKFLFPGSTFSVRYFGRNDLNRNLKTALSSTPDFVDLRGQGYFMNGITAQFGYAGLDFAYGIFAFDNAFDASTNVVWGQAFKISYTLKF